MASVTNLDDLFALAAADWNFTPPTLPSGGTAQVAARTVSVLADMQFINPPPANAGNPLEIFPGIYQGTLNYSPARKIPRSHGLPMVVPASFSGSNNPRGALGTGGTDFTQLFFDISQSGAGGYDVSISVETQSDGSQPNPPISVTAALPAPGGQEGNPTEEGDSILASISYTVAAYLVEISQYSFLVTLKKGAGANNVHVSN